MFSKFYLGYLYTLYNPSRIDKMYGTETFFQILGDRRVRKLPKIGGPSQTLQAPCPRARAKTEHCKHVVS